MTNTIENFIHLPPVGNNGEDYADLLNRYRRILINTFGGYTEMQAQGGWIDPESGQLYSESMIRFAVAFEPVRINTERFRELATRAKAEFDQEAIYICINNTVEFI